MLVGVNKYAQNPLRFCVADAKLMADTLAKNCGYPRSHILLLTDDQPDPDLRPTKINLQKQITVLLKKVKEKDTVLVSFGGHGFAADGQSFFCPLDFDGDNPKLTGWRTDEVRSLLHDCRAAQKLLVLDCCHSGGSRVASPDPSGQEVGGAFEHARGLITLAACRKDETAAETDGHGLFTRHLARGLFGAADYDGNGIVDSDELYRFVLVEVTAGAGRLRPPWKQTPVRIIGEDVVGVFALARPAGPAPAEEVRPPGLKPGDAVVNSAGMKLVFLPPALAVVGSHRDEYKRNDDEVVQPVILSGNLYMGAYEVTQGEYLKVTGKNPSYFAISGDGREKVADLDTARFPVEQVSWDEAVEFCRRLSALPAEKAARRVYRLPTDAEWEYACRANTSTVFFFGDRLSPREANIRGDRPYLDSPEGPSPGRTVAVGSYKPNAFGLYDMHGNVGEWCADYLAPTPYRAVSWWADLKNGANAFEEVNKALLSSDGWKVVLPTDPTGPRTGDTRVTRGGYYSGEVHYCRSACRLGRLPDYRSRTTGFRVVFTIQEVEAKEEK